MVRRRSPDRFIHETDPVSGGGGGSNGIWIRETPSGAIDGNNVDFVTSHAYLPNTTMLMRNGLVQSEPEDYHELTSTTVRFLDAPQPGDRVTIGYSEA